jgi:hypothetical protein
MPSASWNHGRYARAPLRRPHQKGFILPSDRDDSYWLHYTKDKQNRFVHKNVEQKCITIVKLFIILAFGG